MKKIQSYMKQIFQSYIDIVNSRNENKFWDLVVLTTYDEVQKQSFEKQIEDHFENTHILKAKLYVIADPPNFKLGCGGSTLYVLKILTGIFGPSLYKKRILIIHCGGSSQRLPSYSIPGKIFSPIPIQGFLNTGTQLSLMLDLKLAIYLPFHQCLQPGIFVTCSDDIETYALDLDSLNHESLKTADVVALAHPCDLKTATGHGVYVLPDLSHNTSSVVVSDCLEVLQKPSISLMAEKDAIFHDRSTNEDIVYSDSVFWMSPKAYRPLLSWYLSSSLDSELDAYAHILPCLGRRTRDDKLQKFTDYKQLLFPLLQNMEFKVIALNDSKFYHLGTMSEYLYNFSECKSFREELSIIRDTSKYPLQPFSVPKKESESDIERDSCLIVFSYFMEKNRIEFCSGMKFIVEWCRIELPVRICTKVILSNCIIRECARMRYTSNPITIFEGFLYYTAPVLCSTPKKKTSSYVTVAFEIQADMKKTTKDLSAIEFAGVPLSRLIKEGYLEEKEVKLCETQSYCLWNLKLFREASTAEESFWETHHFINQILHWRDGIPLENFFDVKKSRLFSMKEIAEFRDLGLFIQDRKKLLEIVHFKST